jgi:hypothetical protein
MLFENEGEDDTLVFGILDSEVGKTYPAAIHRLGTGHGSFASCV